MRKIRYARGWVIPSLRFFTLFADLAVAVFVQPSGDLRVDLDGPEDPEPQTEGEHHWFCVIQKNIVLDRLRIP